MNSLPTETPGRILHNLHHRSIRVRNLGFYFLDLPRGPGSLWVWIALIARRTLAKWGPGIRPAPSNAAVHRVLFRENPLFHISAQVKTPYEGVILGRRAFVKGLLGCIQGVLTMAHIGCA